MESLDIKQRTLGQEIQQIITNFKKDSPERKGSIQYFETRIQRLEDAWHSFETTDNEIRSLENVDKNHQYFTQDYYNNVKEATEKYLNIFRSSIAELEQQRPNPLPKLRAQGAKLKQQNETDATALNEKTTALLRRQSAMMASFKRLIDRPITKEELLTTCKYQINAINKLWANIESINFDLCEINDKSEELNYNMEEYIELEEQVHSQLIKLEGTKSEEKTSDKAATVQLPKITIPKFSGNVLEWQQFYDIFSKMIDNHKLPQVQKMWYLKANISGEAERLVRHLTLSEENYDAAWKLLQERYSNKRIIATKLIQQIIDLPNMIPETRAIKNFHDVVHECLLALNNIGVQTSPNIGLDLILSTLIIRKMDKQSHILYEQAIHDPREIQSMDELLSFLQFRFHSLEAVSGNKNRELHSGNNRTIMKATTSVAATKSKPNCVVCKESQHQLYLCPKFAQKSIEERWNCVKQFKLCYNCLKADHSVRDCTSRTCTKCDKKHNTMLHNNSQRQNNELATVAALSNNKSHQGTVLLATARVLITANNGRKEEFRAILDSGSQINLVTERVVKILGIKTQEESINIEGIGSGVHKSTKRINTLLQSRTGQFSTRLEAFVLPKIIANQPMEEVNSSLWQIPQGLQMADPEFGKPGKIDVLLGAEFYLTLLQQGQLRLSKHLPIIQNSQLGWIVSGRISKNPPTNATCAVLCTEEEATNKIIEQFWKLDDMPNEVNVMSSSDNYCEQHFTQTIKTNAEGRFIVKIPFKDSPDTLGESHSIALRRFLALERRLDKNIELKRQYVEFMKAYEELNHMRRISSSDIIQPNYFIPHHCVIKEDSSTTKLRVVFDASTKTTSGQSLNDITHAGPTVQSELFTILLRFRLPRYVFTTDIEKMYRQILIDQEDQRFQIIIWRSNPKEPINYYQLKTVTYGTTSAPYLATKCLQYLAATNMQKYPLGAQSLSKDFYVDDGLCGSDNLNEALEKQRQLTTLLRGSGFKLRKWCANHPQLLQNIAKEDRESDFEFSEENQITIKTLGIAWKPVSDKFFIKAKLEENVKVTKRSVSSDLAKIFDPLGIAGPVVVTAKIFMQELWQLKIEWDEELPPRLRSQWMEYRKNLQLLNGKEFDRRVCTNGVQKKIQLHTFADAPEKAYGAAVYLRVIYTDGRISVRLLCSKSRIAPLKQQTLPRLELCAALLAAELSTRVMKDLNIQNESSFLWTDSEIVLSWINSESKSLHTFVANRVAKVQELTVSQQWRHISTKNNPADIISRGIAPDKLMACDLWFYGPLCLHGQEESWPPAFKRELEIENDSNNK